MAPRYLFRVYSVESNGTNTPNLFRPASATDQTDTSGSTGEKLKIALLGQHSPSTPFIFFTSSLLFALQLATYKRSNGETGIYLTCIDSTTATDSTNGAVKFTRASDLMQRHSVELRNRSDNSVREYEGVFVVMDASVRLGAGSSYITYQELVDKGLYQLYPELEAVTKRRSVRLHLTVTDLRKFWFSGEAHPLTVEKVGVAARLAAASGFVGDRRDTIAAPRHLILWFLALRKRRFGDPALMAWVDRRSARSLFEDCAEPANDVTIPEVDQYKALEDEMQGREFHSGLLKVKATVDSNILNAEVAAWQAWHRQSREQHRATREERPAVDHQKRWRVDKHSRTGRHTSFEDRRPRPSRLRIALIS